MRRHVAFYGASGSAVVDTTATRTTAQHDDWKAREARESAALLYPLVGLCRGARLPEPTPEYTFHPHRKWRFDYAWPLHKVAVEIEGGAFTQGRHTRGAGFIADMEKYNAAVLLGWRVLRFVPDELHHALPALQTLLGEAA